MAALRTILEPLAVAALAAALAGCSASAQKDAPPPPLKQAVIVAQGFVEPAGEVHKLTFLRDGVITQMLVSAGSVVERGQLLAVQDSRACEAQFAEASASLALAKARLEQVKAGKSQAEIAAMKSRLEAARSESVFASAENRRFQELMSRNAATGSDAEQWASAAAASSAKVAAARAELEHLENFARPTDIAVAEQEIALASARLSSAKVAADEKRLASPVAGTILELLKREGESAGPLSPEPVMLAADLGSLRVRAEVEEMSALKVATGTVCFIHMPGLTASVTGRVEQVRDAMGRKTVFAKSARERRDLDTRDVLILLPPATRLPVGLRVDAEIQSP